MEKTIKAHLEGYVQKGQYPFHMPGHKGGRLGAFKEIGQLDITEIAGFDNLHQPTGIIHEAQLRLAEITGANESFFLVNGATCGLEAAVLAVCSPGDNVIVARNCHRSVYSALVLAGVHPIYIQPETEPISGLAGGISPEKLLEIMQRCPHCKAVIITSPTYEGFTSDIKKIQGLACERGMVLIVDEAHGSHFGFHDGFPKSALQCKADIVVQSYHKTLPALTQSAVMHVGGERVDTIRLRQALQMVQTSSPSYLLLASLDECVDFIMHKGKNAFDEYIRRLSAIRNDLVALQNIHLINKQLIGTASIFDIDLGKLCFLLPVCQYTGGDAMDYLRRNHQMELEMAGRHHILAMTSLADSQEGFERLKLGMLDLDMRIKKANKTLKTVSYAYEDDSFPAMALSPREGFFASKQSVAIECAVGRICGEFIIPYPPGIPLLVPGEWITNSSVQKIKEALKFGIAMSGCADNSLKSIVIIK